MVNIIKKNSITVLQSLWKLEGKLELGAVVYQRDIFNQPKQIQLIMYKVCLKEN